MVLKIGWSLLLTLLLSSVTAQSPDGAEALNRQGYELLRQSEYKQARICFQKALEHNATQRSDRENARSLAGYAKSLSTSDFRAADSLYTRALAIAGAKAADNPEAAEFLQGLAEVRILQQKYDGVEAMLDRIVAIRKRSGGERSLAYADALSMQGWYYAIRGDFARSELAFGRAAEIASRITPDSYDLAKIWHKAFFLHYYKQDKAAADSCARQAIALYQKTAAPFDRNLIEIKGSQALAYIPGRIKEAEQIIVDLLPQIERNYGKEDYTYSTLLMTLASIYAFDGRTQQALPLFDESSLIIKRLFGEHHEAYYNLLNNKAMIYMRTERFAEAEALLLQSLESRREVAGEESPAYLKAVNNLAALYLNMGSYERAEGMFRQAAGLAKGLVGEASKSYLLALCNLGLCQMRTGQHQAAIATADICEELLIRHNLTANRDFVELHALNLLTAMHCGKVDPQLGEQIAASAEVLKKTFGERNTTYLNTINGLAGYYLKTRDYDRAMEYAEQDAELTAKYRGKTTSVYLKALSNKAAACYMQHLWSQAETALAECLDIVRKLATNNLAFMSDREREDYWLSIRQPLDNISGLALFAEQSGYDSPALCGLLYDRALLLKSLLLNYSANIRQSVMESGDEELIAIWKQLKTLKSAPTQNAAKIEELDKQLSLRSMPYRNQRSDFAVTWQHVRDQLTEGEAAIEIAAITSTTFDPHYVGLVLRPGDKSPQRVMLGSEESIAAASQDINSTTAVVFTPLEKHLRGVRCIYLSTSGVASKFSFAQMGTRRNYLIDRYSISNLLSTKDILTAKQRQTLSGAGSIALFGGADFGLPVAELDNPSETSDLLRGQGFDYLPGSKKEVTDIGRMLASKGWRSTVYSDNQATESRFKALSSVSPDIIHISTHGYYFPAINVDSKTQTTVWFKTADDPLIRCGLLFSGANDAWNGQVTDNASDDGLLTGHEISLMNLSHTRLVVLSACNTALGDNDYSEGIYGLQRAFRMAGAETFLVALWPIPDRETVVFMTQFYQNLTSGLSIRDAFNNTQRTMRQKYPTNTKAWAGFVLVE